MDECGFDFNIFIVGLGLIGGSYAMALRKLNPLSICGIDVDENSLKEAVNRGIIDQGFTDGKEALRKADLVIMATYPEEIVNFMKNNIGNFKKGAVITDTCGIKEGLIDIINSFLPDELDFVGGHPMAGKESKGIKVASDDIFNNANYIITPTERNRKENIMLIEKMARAIGCKKVISISPKEHDKIISFTSQLPHVIAVSLMDSDLVENNIETFTGGSFKDATRVAVINSTLWSELFFLNSDNLITEIERFQKSIEKIKNAIMSEDENTLKHIFKNATARRKKMV
ncbi:prephenate dehydrogenase [Clostridium carboxidivorans P7]|uniref:Prephenate dehydrogenase n=1 Tax=Clostridium carboxidivorans P7 TaxID=536227 RepID=C6PTA8_9CLOT|nr:prephenate dehydrogenase [Clostridium carboxidivorans]AKN30478.1 prephenate dehydrogenase [Clostridium carboxidivorans P7]EET87528.1 Prephenate dehydrogenase [Clostridium carboxidivorans P7]EFG86223.1 prephenate dehydrogenase [Clostridium carboxidivorans P7]